MSMIKTMISGPDLPDVTDTSAKLEEEARRKARAKVESLGSGRGKNLITGGAGVTDEPNLFVRRAKGKMGEG